MRHAGGEWTGSGTGSSGKHLACALAAALLVLAAAAEAGAADGAKVMDCIKTVSKSSWAGFQTRELLASIACQGIRDVDADSPGFKARLAVIGDCFKKVSFRSGFKGPEAELVAANACVGSTSASETAACMDKVVRSFRHARDQLAESLAATACSRGNPAEETAACVKTVAFRLNAGGTLADTLAAIACGR